MLLQIPEVLSIAQIDEFRAILSKANWVDGKATAGYQSALVKNNSQLPENSDEARILGGRVLEALEQNPLFISAALPNRIFPPLFNRYETGQNFGTHIDNAIRVVTGTNFKIRTDLSATLFLSNPDEYEGGELVIEDTYGMHKVKLPAGHMILYPASSLHFVNEVKSGVRLASFLWIESMVRDDSARTILFDLDNAIRSLNHDHPQHDSIVQLTGIYHNLLRRYGMAL